MIKEENLPYGMTSGNNMHNRISIGMMEAAYRVNDRQLADKIAASVEKDILQQRRYYQSLNTQQQAALEYESSMNENLVQALNAIRKNYTERKNNLE